MGPSRGIVMGFDLSALIAPVEGLDVLTKPFEKEEMDNVVKHMPVDKAPGQMVSMARSLRNVGISFPNIFMS